MSRENERTLIEHDRKLIGVSNTYMRGRGWLEHAADDIQEVLADTRSLVVVPYALADMDWYTDKLREVFTQMGIENVDSPHRHPGSENLVIEDAEAVYIGGGNTGRLVANLHSLTNFDGSKVDKRKDASQQPLVSTIRKRVSEGMPLVGASAGANVMCQDIRTTNDMHIAVQQLVGGVLVSRLDALGVLPSDVSINPHYIENVVVSEEDRRRAIEINEGLGILLDHQGESRETRLKQVLEMDPTRTILALREGAYIVVNGQTMELRGQTGGLIFQHEKEPVEIQAGDNLSNLLVS
ncbi:Type 1 glutamine amidotransferase-like domain-containing protein [Patescibacteria group bacterium]